MSAFGFARNATKAYLKNMNAGVARQMLGSTFRAGKMAYSRGGMRGLGSYGRKAAGVWGRYMWGNASDAERVVRIGTAAAGLGVARNFLDPENNFGPF